MCVLDEYVRVDECMRACTWFIFCMRLMSDEFVPEVPSGLCGGCGGYMHYCVLHSLTQNSSAGCSCVSISFTHYLGFLLPPSDPSLQGNVSGTAVLLIYSFVHLSEPGVSVQVCTYVPPCCSQVFCCASHCNRSPVPILFLLHLYFLSRVYRYIRNNLLKLMNR